jgi:hypothetical protein
MPHATIEWMHNKTCIQVPFLRQSRTCTNENEKTFVLFFWVGREKTAPMKTAKLVVP